MASTGSGYCSRTDIHEGCEKQRQCSRKRCIGPCEGWQLSKKGARMLGTCAACTTDRLEHNPANNAAVSARKRALALAALLSNPSLRGLTRHSDHELYLIGALCLRRTDVAPLFARGSQALINIYQWTCAHETGWGAPEAALRVCERKESLSALIAPKSPPLRVRDGEEGLRKILPSDISIFEGSGAYIIRLVISPILCDITKIEKFMHTVISRGDVVGFKTWVKDGGSPAQQQRFIYGVSILVIPDPAELGLVVNEKYREAHALELARFGGREGRVVLPDAPPAAFVETLRREASTPLFVACRNGHLAVVRLRGAIVLGGPRVEVERGLISAEEAAEAGVGGSQSQGASQGASQEE